MIEREECIGKACSYTHNIFMYQENLLDFFSPTQLLISVMISAAFLLINQKMFFVCWLFITINENYKHMIIWSVVAHFLKQAHSFACHDCQSLQTNSTLHKSFIESITQHIWQPDSASAETAAGSVCLSHIRSHLSMTIWENITKVFDCSQAP